MDPLSLAGGVIAIITLVTSCLKGINKHIGPSVTSSAEIEKANETLYNILSVTSGFKTYLDLHDEDEDHMNILEVLAPVVTETLNAVQIIKDYVGSGRTERAFRGVRFDRKLTKALKSLDEASKVFKMAVSANLQ